jgi:hypothetical protein
VVLRQATIQCLQNFALEMKALTKADQYRSLAADAVDQKLREFDEHLNFVIRQFDTGFIDPHEPERPHVNNSINIGSMTGSAIQQGSPGAKQSVEFSLDIDEAKAALAAFEASINATQLSQKHLDEINADLRTIAAQLSKTSASFAFRANNADIVGDWDSVATHHNGPPSKVNRRNVFQRPPTCIIQSGRSCGGRQCLTHFSAQIDQPISGSSQLLSRVRLA